MCFWFRSISFNGMWVVYRTRLEIRNRSVEGKRTAGSASANDPRIRSEGEGERRLGKRQGCRPTDVCVPFTSACRCIVSYFSLKEGVRRVR
ncbi:hypothetical protein M3J09_002585 [Ascochyta lentis]